MLKIKNSTKFKRDLKKFQHQQYVMDELDEVLKALINQKPLAPKYHDHFLVGR